MVVVGPSAVTSARQRIEASRGRQNTVVRIKSGLLTPDHLSFIDLGDHVFTDVDVHAIAHFTHSGFCCIEMDGPVGCICHRESDAKTCQRRVKV